MRGSPFVPNKLRASSGLGFELYVTLPLTSDQKSQQQSKQQTAMKQRIVIKVQMSGDKSRSKALGLVASTHGVQSVAIEGRERNHVVVIGDGLDAVSLTSYLRKKVGGAQIVQVEVVGGGAEKTKPEPVAAAAVVTAGPQQWQPRGYSSGYYYSRKAAVHPYAGQYRYDDDDSHSGAVSSCAVM